MLSRGPSLLDQQGTYIEGNFPSLTSSQPRRIIVTTTTEVNPFAAAVAAAQAETVGEPTVEPAEDHTQDLGTEALPADDQADTQSDDQPHVEGTPADPLAEDPASEGDEAPAGEEELFGDFEIEEPPAPEIEDQTFQLPGIDEPVTFEQLKDGYLRQADYTRKTQEVAAQRKENERAISFWEAFTQHPKEVVLQLAKEAGLDVGTDAVQKMVDLPFTSEEQLQALVDQEVEARLAEHPAVVAAQKAEVDAWIDESFATIEKDLEITLGPASREKVLLRAYQAQTDDLAMVTRAMLAEMEAAKARTERLKQASPKRPTGAPSVETNTEPAGSFKEAAEMAAAEIAARSRKR